MTQRQTQAIVMMKARPEQAPRPAGAGYRFHAMVKPIGSLCNLDCPYCYYLHKETLLGQPKQPRMVDQLLEEHIRQYIEAQTGEEVVFSWQGGEPTILGLEFFRKVVALQARYKKPGQRIENDLQTNGTLLDADWAAFLRQHGFLVGLSCDGPKALHDRYRFTKGGASTHDKVVAAAKLLQQHGVPFVAMCVVNRENAKQPLEVYRFLTRELGAKRVQFMSCVEPQGFDSVAPQHWDRDRLPVVGTPRASPGAEDSIVTDWSVAAEDWGSFLSAVWDDWYAHDYGKVHIDLFENVVAQSLGMPAQRCVTAEFCGKALAVEHNGDVFSCDHYVYPEYRLGNIADTHWGDMAYSAPQQKFGFAKRDTLPEYCRQCSYLKLCWGECPKNRLVRTPSGEPGLNYLCPGLKHFYAHIQRDMPKILQQVSASLRRSRGG
ncbi:anaerobic sulfatase maturase [Niveibacterium sp. 24ML]|uniref:anaerobic sulfatase maturase n=1 Tax=Niveibacterium sp. 24ML TaxID=2985512 RepID=UPI00226EB3AA|nr:anaerobic sulfatase maturase [Niveibacterium sp. 24ML]MCX9155582.1 anaerobic sulfatase maturase [Niveibacterium sp. 24ML]